MSSMPVFAPDWVASLPSNPTLVDPFPFRVAKATDHELAHLRDIVEKLVGKIPQKHIRKQMIRRVRKSTESFRSAFTELAVADALDQVGFDVSWDVSVRKQTPDLLITRHGASAIVEVSRVGSVHGDEPDILRLRRRLKDEIRPHGVFFNKVKVEGWARVRGFVAHLKKEIGSLEFDESLADANLGQALESGIQRKYQDDGMRIEYKIVPFAAATFRESYIGSYGGMHSVRPDRRRILNRLKRKRKKYKFPFIPALDLQRPHMRLDYVEHVLLGDDITEPQERDGILTVVHEGNGYSLPDRIPAVLVSEIRHPAKHMGWYVMLCAIQNPSAAVELPEGFFDGIPAKSVVPDPESGRLLLSWARPDHLLVPQL